MTKTDTEPTGQIYDDGAKPMKSTPTNPERQSSKSLEQSFTRPNTAYPSNNPSRPEERPSNYTTKELEKSEQNFHSIENGTSDEMVSSDQPLGIDSTVRNYYTGGSEIKDNNSGIHIPTKLASKTSIKGFFGKFNNKQRGFGFFGIIATILSVVFLSAINTGPMQFLQFGQLLQRIHLTSQDEQANTRSSLLVRYMMNGKLHPQETRLGFLGNQYADSVEKQLNKQGFTTDYDKTTGKFKGYIVDINTFEKGKYKGNPEGLRARLSTELGINIDTLEDGKLKIPNQKMSYFKNRKLIKYTIGKSTNNGKIISYMKQRIMIKRAGVTFHPIKKADASSRQKIVDIWREHRKKVTERVKNGAIGRTVSADYDKPVDEDGKPVNDPSRDTVVSNTEQAHTAAQEGHLAQDIGRGAAATGLVVGAACIAQAMLDNITEYNRKNIIEPGIRISSEIASVASQVMAGNDIDEKILGAYMPLMGVNKQNGNWMAAHSIQKEIGNDKANEKNSKKLPSELNPNPSQNAFQEFLNNIPGLGTICEVIGNPIVSIGINVIGGPIQAVIGEAISRLVIGPILESITEAIKDDPIDVFNPKYAGGPMGEFINVSFRLYSNNTMAASGGRPLSQGETNSLTMMANSTINEDNKTRSIADRYLNPNKYDSVTGRIINESGSNNALMAITKIPVKALSNFGTNIAYLFTDKAIAGSVATDEDYYGIPKVGFSVAEFTDERLEDPYENAELAKKALAGPKGGEYKSLIEDCFKITINDDLSSETKEEVTTYRDQHGDDYTTKCQNNDDFDFVRIRMAIYDTTVNEAIACFFGFNESCQKLDSSASSGSENNVGDGQPGEPIQTRFGPFVFPVQTTKENIKNNNPHWCYDKKDITCHGTENYGYYASDIFIKEGVTIVSATDGVVVKVEQDAPNKAGNATEAIVTIKGNDCDNEGNDLSCKGKGTVFWYAHMAPRSATVKVGDEIKAGQVIAKSGGAAQGDGSAHLHFDASDRKNQFRMPCSREDKSGCAEVGFINTQPELYKAFNNIGAGASISSDGWVWPMQKDLKTGNCWNAIVGGKYHAGMDINTDNVSENNPAVAAHSGTVVAANKSGGAAGNYITIKSDDGIYYSYEHLTSFKVKVNDTVTANQPVGIIGKTGNVSASSAGHLHFVTAKTNTLGSYSSSPQTNTFDPLDVLPEPAPGGYECIP